MKVRLFTVTSLAVLCVVGCAKKPDAAKLNAQVKAYWRPCSAVSVTPVKIDATDGKVVRFSYKVKLLKNGAATGANECPAANSSMLAAMANEDFVNLKANTEIDFTQEQPL
ncbi:MAG: hypothetical protein Q4G39_07705 [Brachymonas sp.]|nr:hypothetical protein [Brachymonas sp.]